MMGTRQGQEGGDDSLQFQAGRDLIIEQNMPEGIARETMEASAQIALASFQRGQEVAYARMGQLEERVIASLSLNGTLGALADPAVQLTLRNAQVAAAATEREADYDLLAELLNARVAKPSDRPARAGINRATEIVGDLDIAALRGLTMAYIALSITPREGDPLAGVNKMGSIIGRMLEEGALPSGMDWLEHLDILDAVRISAGQTFRTFDDYWPSRTPGYVCVGISEEDLGGTSDPDQLIINAVGGTDLAVDHAYKPGYKRLSVPTLRELESRLDANNASGKDELLRLGREHFKVEEVDVSASTAYMRDVRANDNLRQLEEWWTSLPTAFNVTVVGRVVANANARRLSEHVPEI